MFSELAWEKRPPQREGLRGVVPHHCVRRVPVLHLQRPGESDGAPLLAQNPKTNIVESIQSLIGMLSVFVWAVLAFLILYASGFLVRRRKKELGTYLLLGMERWQVARLLLAETACIGAIALAAGLALGVLAALGPERLYRRAVRRAHDLLHLRPFRPRPGQDRPGLRRHLPAGDGLPRLRGLPQPAHRPAPGRPGEPGPPAPEPGGVGGPLPAGGGAAGRGLRHAAHPWPAAGGRPVLGDDRLGSLGTLLFFRSLSGFLLRICQSRRGFYLKNLNLFVLRQFNARINTTYRSMTVICLMLLLAIGITASSVGLNNTVSQMAEEQLPQDVSLTFYPDGEEPVDLPALLAEGGFDRGATAPSISPSRYSAPKRGRPLPSRCTTPMPAAGAGRRRTPFLEREQLAVRPDGEARGAWVNCWFFLADYAGDKQAAEDAFQGR